MSPSADSIFVGGQGRVRQLRETQLRRLVDDAGRKGWTLATTGAGTRLIHEDGNAVDVECVAGTICSGWLKRPDGRGVHLTRKEVYAVADGLRCDCSEILERFDSLIPSESCELRHAQEHANIELANFRPLYCSDLKPCGTCGPCERSAA